MKCQEVANVLAAYFDGELAERQSRQTAAHLAACASCAAEYAELQREQELFMRYERDIEVTPQLWQGVQARLATEQTEQTIVTVPFGARLRAWFASALIAPRFSPALTAALLVVAITLTIGVMKFTARRESASTNLAQTQSAPPATTTSSPNQTTASPAPSVAPIERAAQFETANANLESRPNTGAKRREERRDKNLLPNSTTRSEAANLNVATLKREPTPDDLVKDAEAKYQKAIEILNRDVARRQSPLDAETRARYDDTLKSLDRTIAETRRVALGRNNDPVAVQYMLTAYAKKVEVLREMARN